MALTVQTLREFGEYLGFCEVDGYLYKMKGTVYAYNRNGLVQVA